MPDLRRRHPEVTAERRGSLVAPATTATSSRDRAEVAGLAILAFALQVPNLGRAYWVDEGISIGIASHPLRQIPGLLHRDGSPPLFYFLLHFWMRIFGSSEIATHLLPLVTSVVAVPIGFWAGRELFDRRAGLAAAALLATNPFLGWYSTETRMYPLMIVLGLVGLTFAVRAVRSHRRADLVGAVLAYTAILYTHNWGVYFFVVSVMAFGGSALYRRDRRLVVGVAATAGVVFLLWLPWLPSLVEQAGSTAAPWAVRPQIGDFFADPSTALGGTLGVIVAPLLAAGAWFTRRHRPLADAELARILGAIGVGTALAGWLAAQVEPSWAGRYLAVVVAPLLLASAGALASSVRGRQVVVAVCVLLAGWSALGTLKPNPNATYAKSNVKAVVLAVARELSPGDVVVVTQTEQVAVLSHYLPKGLRYVTPTGPVADPGVVDWRHLIGRLRAAQPCQAVAPSINALPVGAAVLEIAPMRYLGASGTAWYHAVNTQVIAIDLLLATDPSLEAVASYEQGTRPRPYSPVVAELFRKVPGGNACG